MRAFGAPGIGVGLGNMVFFLFLDKEKTNENNQGRVMLGVCVHKVFV